MADGRGVSCAVTARPPARARRRLAALALAAASLAAALGVAPGLAPGAAAAVAAAGPVSVSPLAFGARGDGRTDDTAALQRALDSLRAGDTLVVPPYRTFNHSGVLRLRVDGARIGGTGTLRATDPAASALWVEADRAVVSSITLASTATRRGGTWDDTALLVKGTTGVTVERVKVRGGASAGIFVDSSTGFTIRDVDVRDTLADGIHVTDGSSHGAIVRPRVQGSGDDGIAVVSYRGLPPVTDVTITAPKVLTTTWGRGLSVVGGTDIRFTDVYVHSSDAAGIYIASESNWGTNGPTRVTVDRGTLVGSNTSATVDHGAILVFSGDPAAPAVDVRVSDVTVRDTSARASREVGILGAPARGVRLERIAVVGGSRPLLVVQDRATTYAATGWTRDGRPVPDVGR